MAWPFAARTHFTRPDPDSAAYSSHIDHKFRQKLINIPVAITSSPLS